MKISFLSKKTLAALALVIPLTLTACGSEESDEAAGAASSSSERGSSSASAAKDADKENSEGDDNAEGEDTDDPEADPNNPNAAQRGSSAAGGSAGGSSDQAMMNPLEEGQIPTANIQPLETGRPGTAEEAAEIKANLNQIYDQTTVQGMTNALVDNTCARVLEENGGEQVFDLGGQDVALADLGMDTSQNYVEDVRDVKIDGDRASATVEVHTAEGNDSTTQVFQREGGRWKMCN